MKSNLFTVGPFVVHGYGLMIALGFLGCVLLAMHRAKKYGKNSEAFVDLALAGIICGFIGAKLLYVIVNFADFLESPLSTLGSEGFVVYGGVIAGVFAGWMYCRLKRLDFWEYFDLAVASIALAQGFGRLGCFLAGCCYGKETDSIFGVTFPSGSISPSGVKLIPTQLISAAGDFAIMGILIFYYKKAKHAGQTAALYMALYGVGRFAVEFLRGDDRGALGPLSVSQWISILVVLYAAFAFWKATKRKTQ